MKNGGEMEMGVGEVVRADGWKMEEGGIQWRGDGMRGLVAVVQRRWPWR